MSRDDIAVKVSGLSKCYQIYDKPHDRLAQGMRGLRRLRPKRAMDNTCCACSKKNCDGSNPLMQRFSMSPQAMGASLRRNRRVILHLEEDDIVRFEDRYGSA